MDRPSPEEYQPRLTWWRQTWRLVLCVLISAVVWVPYIEGQVEARPIMFWVDAVLGLVSFGLVFLRRRWPVTIAVVTSLLTAVSGLAAGPATLATVSLATRRRITPIVVVAAVAVVAGTFYTEVQPSTTDDPAWLMFAASVIAIGATMAWGMYIGSRRELLYTLQSRAERAESEQELRVTQARLAERARIAREMHDVLAHRISQVAMHAGALSFRQDLSADELRTGTAEIRERAHEALADLRGVLGVLRDGAGEVHDAPQPTYCDIPALVEEARETGLNVQFLDEVGGADVPEAVGRTVYRIIQEGITNARKHAPGALLRIELTGSPEEGIDVVLRNPLGFGRTDTPGAGLGLVGLSERAQLRGGRLEHRHEDRAFVLHGWIPWAA